MCLDIRQINIIIYFLNFYLFYCYFILFYELNCKSAQALDMDLQSALSFMDSNNVLLINFGDVSESIINTEVENKRLFFRKQSGGLKPGVIAAIVISLIVVLVAIISLVLYIRKQNLKSKYNSEDSTIRKINTFK